MYEGEKETPLRLRVTAYPAAGMAGERFPIVGHANNYSPAPGVQVLGYFSYTDRYKGESVGITETVVGRGRIVAFAFDLALCVLLLRQGDPNRAEVIPEGTECARPSSMAIDIGPPDSGWVPFADLLSRILVDTVRRYLPGPVPLLSHLPGMAPGILLYSGDEDNADVASNDAEFECVAAAGGRMNLYIIPNRTKSTALDVERYRVQHDVGPHPNLRPLDGCSISERLTEFERQIRRFQDRFDTPARSLRNHCTAWAGYLEPVEVMEKMGVGMDGNYFSGTYGYSREDAPYAAFGGAGRMDTAVKMHRMLRLEVLCRCVSAGQMVGRSMFSNSIRSQSGRRSGATVRTSRLCLYRLGQGLYRLVLCMGAYEALSPMEEIAMRFGIGRRDITPPLYTHMHGYAARRDTNDGVNDPLTFTKLETCVK